MDYDKRASDLPAIENVKKLIALSACAPAYSHAPSIGSRLPQHRPQFLRFSGLSATMSGRLPRLARENHREERWQMCRRHDLLLPVRDNAHMLPLVLT